MITDFVRIGHAPDDTESSRRLKSLSAICIFVLMIVTFGFFLESPRSPIYRAVDIAALAAQFAGLIALHRTKKAENLFHVAAPPYVIVNLVYFLLNGNREGDTLPFLVISALAVVVIGPQKSRPWFVVCFLVMLIVPLINDYLPEITLAINQTTTNPTGSLFHSPIKQPLALGEGLAMTAGVFFVYFLTYSGYRQLEAARELIELQKAELEHEYGRSERLLENIMPRSIAKRLKHETADVIADDIPHMTILFADIVDFTPRASRMSAPDVVAFLNRIFTEFDVLADKHGLEKIKTIGDAYMVAGGMPEPRDDHAAAVADMAFDILQVTEKISEDIGERFTVRIGIHTGPAVAGVIGTRKVFYDVWGDTVNTASRLETYGMPGRIQTTREVYDALSDRYTFEPRGTVDIKGKGEIQTYFLTGSGAAET